MKKFLSFLFLLAGLLFAGEVQADPDYLCFTAQEATDVAFKKSNESWTPTATLQYSTNKTDWTDYAFGTGISLAAGDKVYFKATSSNSTFSESNSKYIKFTSTGKVAASGNIMSLLDGTNFADQSKVTLPAYAFFYLFMSCKTLTTAPSLPATTLAECCYDGMFTGCENLVNAPALPAKRLAKDCYYSMFSSCTALTTAPELPATELAASCYFGMFAQCTSLTTAPELPATELAASCYYGMFTRCTSLTTAPELPATTLTDSCYFWMFASCTALTKAPALPATTLAKQCYNSMFFGCTSLNEVKVSFTDWRKDLFVTKESKGTTYYYYPTSDWLKDVAAEGTFYCPVGLVTEQTTKDASTVPTTWTVESGHAACYLDESSTTIPSFVSETKYSGTVKRTLKTGQWNSLCLPFSMTEKGVTDTLKVASGKLMKMTSISNNVVNFETATEIEAGAMYIIEPTEAVTSFTISGKTMSTLTDGALSKDFSYYTWAVVSPMFKTTISQQNINTKYVLSGNKFYKVDQQDLEIKGFRWYITDTTGSYAKSGLGINFDGEATGITTADIDAVAPTEGKYLENGRIVIMKNNHKFNLNGQEVK